jgi:hypothetical protein|tara:strand:+ start:225 stop:470 length:246 start_codon:yes stop_codon:yes gene_type:complete
MEIKKLLEIESIISGRKTPSDMNDDALNAHYSKSRGEEIKILDMHLPHLVRAYSNMLIYDKEWNDKSYNEGWNDALEQLKK